jgi:hypothetical protein
MNSCTGDSVAAGPLSAYDVPVGLLATVLKRLERAEASLCATSISQGTTALMPAALPARSIPEPHVAASVERFYAGGRPMSLAKHDDDTISGGGMRVGSGPQTFVDERQPVAYAQAEMTDTGVRADGSKASGHGRQQHVGLGAQGTEGPNAYSDFRMRKGNTYREQISQSKAVLYGA